MKQTIKTQITRAILILCSFGFVSSASGADEKDAVRKEVMAVLDAFMVSFSASDPKAHTATYHFPHFRLANGAMNSWQTREDAIKAHEQIFPRLRESGWHRSEWIERNVIGLSDTKVHVVTKFRRLRADGSEIVTAESLYVLTLEQGRWGIKLRSSYLK